MTATAAERSKTYHDKQRAKLARAEAMEGALHWIWNHSDDATARKIAEKALQELKP